MYWIILLAVSTLALIACSFIFGYIWMQYLLGIIFGIWAIYFHRLLSRHLGDK